MDFISMICSGYPPWVLAIICPALFVAGFVDAIGGGGGLISIPAYLFCGLPAHAAIATNKMSSTMGTCVATLKYALRGYMNWRLCATSAVLACAGSVCGSNLALVTSERVLMIAMLVILPVVGGYTLIRKDLQSNKPAFSPRKTAVLCAAIAFVIGIYDGFYGPGTGTFLMLLLCGLARLDVFSAAGVTKAINLTTNVSALAVFLIHGEVLLGLGIVAGVFNIAGNYVGATLFTNRGAKIVRPIILVVIVIFALRLISQLFF